MTSSHQSGLNIIRTEEDSSRLRNLHRDRRNSRSLKTIGDALCNRDIGLGTEHQINFFVNEHLRVFQGSAGGIFIIKDQKIDIRSDGATANALHHPLREIVCSILHSVADAKSTTL